MKRTAVFVIMVLICLQIPFTVSASADEKILNGSFETILPSGVPSDWGFMQGSFGSEFTLDGTDPFSGSKALCISGTSSMYAIQSISLVENTKYCLEALIKISSLSSGASAAFELQYKDSLGNYVGNGSSCSYTDLNGGKWQWIRYEFITEEDVTKADLHLELLEGGTICWDLISISNVEMVVNGSFEQLASYWNTTAYSSNISITEGYTGNAIKIANNNSTASPYAAQLVKGFNGGAVYKISGYYRTENIDGKGAGIKIEAYDSNGIYVDQNEKILDTSQEWQYFEYIYTLPQSCIKAYILTRLYGTGTACFDNISVIKTKNAKTMKIVPETLFYYTENITGEISVTINKAPPTGAKIDLKIKDGETVKEARVFNNPESENNMSFNLSDVLTTTGYGYTVSAEYTTAAGSVIEAAEETIYRYNRPTHLNAKGEFIDHNAKGEIIDDGKNTFIPIIGYHIPISDYAMAAKAGINVVQCSYSGESDTMIEKTLTAAKEYGMKVLMPLYPNMKPAAHPDNVTYTVHEVTKFMDNTAIYGWMVMDEPQPDSDQMYEYLKASYKLIRDIDSEHPVYICECSESSFVQSGQCCDVLCVDPYPGLLSEMPTKVYNNTKLAKEAVNFKKPVYTLIQAWNWKGWEPSSNDLRHMLYQALMAGADGLGYYPLYDSDSTMWELELWNGAVGFNLYEKESALKAFVTGDYSLTQNTDSDSVHYAVYSGDGETYITVINLTASEQHVTIPVTAAGTLQDVNGGDKNAITRSGEQLTVPLEAYQAVCYKISFDNVPGISAWRGNARLCALSSGEIEIRKSNVSGYKIYSALYEDYGTSKKLYSISDISLSDRISVSLQDGTEYELNIFCWDSINNIAPLTKQIKLEE